MEEERKKEYWRRNLKYLTILLTIWFVSSYGVAIMFYEEMNSFKIGGFELGFWFAHQGSIYIFVIIIFVYVWLMNKLDKEFDLEEKS